MKKALLMAVAVSVCGFSYLASASEGAVQAKTASVAVQNAAGQIVAVDSLLILQKSKEGQELASKIQKEVKSFEELVKKAQTELADLQESINKKADVLSKEALQEKTEELVSKKDRMERELAEKQKELQKTLSKQEFQLREKQRGVMNKISEENNWSFLVDKNTPGVFFVAKAIDQTDIILKKIDEDFSSSLKSGKVKTMTAKNATPVTEKKVKAA